MESEALEDDCIDSDDGLSPRDSPRVPVRVWPLSPHTPPRLEPAFLSASNEEVYEDSPRPVEISSATAKIVASIYGEFQVEMKASDITLSLEAMALKEGTEMIALYGAKLATFEELLDPENVDPIVTREECFVALQRWHKSCDCHVTRVDGKDVLLPPDPPIPDDEDEAVYNCTLSPCCRRVPNEEVDELRHQNKLLQKSIDGLQFQLTTNEKKLIHLKDEKFKLTQEARELRTTIDMYYGFKIENDILERDNTRLSDVVLALKEDLMKAKKESDDFKKKTEDLDDTTNALTLKLEQCVQNETVFNNLTSRKLAQFNVLQTRLDAATEKLSEKETEIVQLKLVIQQYEERFTELRRAKARDRRRGAESDYSESVSQLAMFDTPHVYVGDSHKVPTVSSSPVIGGMSLFAELQSADQTVNICRNHRDAFTSYEFVSTNRATQTPEMEDDNTQTVDPDDNIEMYPVTQNSLPILPVMCDRETQTVEITENMTFGVNRNSTPDKEDSETQTVEDMETYLVAQYSTPYMVDHETQTDEIMESVDRYLATHILSPDREDRDTQTVECIRNMEMYLVSPSPTTASVEDHATQTNESCESVDSYLMINNASLVMEDHETQTNGSNESVDTYQMINNASPDMEDHETQTNESIESVDTSLVIQNGIPDMEDCGTQTGESIEQIDRPTYLVTQNLTPYLMEDRATQTSDGDHTVAMYSARNATSELQETEDRDAWTTNRFRSTFVMNVGKETTVRPETGVSFMSYRAIVPVKRDRARARDSSDERGFYTLSSDERNVESDGRRRYSFPDGQSFTINCEETSAAKPTALTMANADVDGSGDASCSPFGVVSSNPLEDVVMDTRYAPATPSPRSPPRRSYHHGVRKRASSNLLRRNDAHVALDREMALLGIEIEGVSRSAQRQFTVVGRALEQALEEAENNGRAIQELRFAHLAEGRTRCAATMTVMFPLRRSVSESPVGCSASHRPVRRGRLLPATVRRDGNRSPPPPPISEPAHPRMTCVPNAAETMDVGSTRRHSNYTDHAWRFVYCGFFMLLALLMAYTYQCYDCRSSRVRPSLSQMMFDQLERYGVIKRNNGPRPM